MTKVSVIMLGGPNHGEWYTLPTDESGHPPMKFAVHLPPEVPLYTKEVTDPVETIVSRIRQMPIGRAILADGRRVWAINWDEGTVYND